MGNGVASAGIYVLPVVKSFGQAVRRNVYQKPIVERIYNPASSFRVASNVIRENNRAMEMSCAQVREITAAIKSGDFVKKIL